MSDELKDWELEILVYAPLWVYSAVTSAGGTADPSQFRRFQELLGVPDAGVEASEAGRSAVAVLRAEPEATFAAYVLQGDEPRKGLERARSVLKRLPDAEREAITRWLVEIGIRIAEASRTLGESAISHPEAEAIRDIAKWLDAPKPDLGPR